MNNTAPPIVSRNDAKSRGAVRFFTGIACLRGHRAERFTAGGQCCECQKAAFRAYRKANLAKESNRRAAYYRANRDAELAYYAANKDQIRPKRDAYYKANAKRISERVTAKRQANMSASLQQERERRRKNAETLRVRRKAWLDAHPEWRKVKRQRRRAREQGAPGDHTIDDLQRLYRRQAGRCAYCFCTMGEKYTVDHIVALSRGGSNDVSNLQLVCRPCNARKWAKDPICFAQELGRLL